MREYASAPWNIVLTLVSLAAVVLGEQRALAQAQVAEAAKEVGWRRFSYTQPQMGVAFTLIFYAPQEEAANAAAIAVYDRIAALNAIFSDYEPESELTRLGRMSPHDQPVLISPELAECLEISLDVAERSDGAFDPTVGPVVKLWRQARRNRKLPEGQALAGALQSVGFRHVEFDAKAKTVRMSRPGTGLDLGGIAKGYALDAALAVLREHGITMALAEAGGDMAIGDPPPGRTGWTVGVEALSVPGSPPDRLIEVKNCGVAASGDAYQFVEIAGKRYSHIVDPKTGLGLTDRCRVTVVAMNGTLADGLATAISVLGPKKGLELLKHYPEAEAIIVRAPDGKVQVHETEGLRDMGQNRR